MMTQPDFLQLIKALLPFMEYSMQRSISALIRAYELKSTMLFYNSPANCNIFKTCSNCSGINFNTPINELLNNEKLISTITTYCSGNIVNMINTYKSFAKMSDLFNMMEIFNTTAQDNSSACNNTACNNTDCNNTDCNNTDLLKNFMNSSQKDMYEEYIRQLDSLDLKTAK